MTPTVYFFAFTVPFASPRSSPLPGTRAMTWISAGLSSFRVKVISRPSFDSMVCFALPGTGIHRKSISFTSGFTVSFALTSCPTKGSFGSKTSSSCGLITSISSCSDSATVASRPSRFSSTWTQTFTRPGFGNAALTPGASESSRSKATSGCGCQR
ncbi:MAG: hypothetical protein A4E73_00952 [Syntrophaceae bacterium PtaU1.Bin231]|nr:MAG: hypothetical protein A4E73_00952 [Syntrophaceae bacterium PtaU1.Bin231]